MKKTNVKKLKISRETIVILQPQQLDAVVGGNSYPCLQKTYGSVNCCPTTAH